MKSTAAFLLKFILLVPPTGIVLASIGSDGVCRSDNCDDTECIFTVKVNLFASELGYYQFEECDDETNPTIGIEVGWTYRFVQSDRSNWFHPLGFGYGPDGALAGNAELEPGIHPPYSSNGCVSYMACPAPMYYLNGEYLGTYNNNPYILDGKTVDEDDFGLDYYETSFGHPPPEWVEYGEFSVTLYFPETDGFYGDIFYFCHIHQFMTGRIKLLNHDDELLQDSDTPDIPYEYDVPSEYDEGCGTFGLEDFQLEHPECPDTFVCNVPDDNSALGQFSDCIDSMNCHMFVGMTTNVNTGSETALFIHQMIPHHQNAVNMAKTLLKTGNLVCDDLTQETDDCIMETILREIVNTQNAQIQLMRGVLENQFPNYPTDDCVVEVATTSVGSLRDELDGFIP